MGSSAGPPPPDLDAWFLRLIETGGKVDQQLKEILSAIDGLNAKERMPLDERTAELAFLFCRMALGYCREHAEKAALGVYGLKTTNQVIHALMPEQGSTTIEV